MAEDILNSQENLHILNRTFISNLKPSFIFIHPFAVFVNFIAAAFPEEEPPPPQLLSELG